MNRKGQQCLSLVTAALGLLEAVGEKTFLHPCIHEDGTAATCETAGQMIFWLGAALALGGIGAALLKGRARIAAAGGMVVLSVLLILAPGVLSPVCGMAEMACRMIMQPAARVTGGLSAVLSLGLLISVLRHRRLT